MSCTPIASGGYFEGLQSLTSLSRVHMSPTCGYSNPQVLNPWIQEAHQYFSTVCVYNIICRLNSTNYCHILVFILLAYHPDKSNSYYPETEGTHSHYIVQFTLHWNRRNSFSLTHPLKNCYWGLGSLSPISICSLKPYSIFFGRFLLLASPS